MVYHVKRSKQVYHYVLGQFSGIGVPEVYSIIWSKQVDVDLLEA